MKSKEFLIVRSRDSFTIYNEKCEEQELPDLLEMLKNDLPILGEKKTDRFFVQYEENQSSETLSYHQIHLFQRIKGEQLSQLDCHKLKSTYKCRSCGLIVQLTYVIPEKETLKR